VEDFVGAKFYCPHALADGKQRIQTREKKLEFSSTVLSTLPLYRKGMITNTNYRYIYAKVTHIRCTLQLLFCVWFDMNCSFFITVFVAVLGVFVAYVSFLVLCTVIRHITDQHLAV